MRYTHTANANAGQYGTLTFQSFNVLWNIKTTMYNQCQLTVHTSFCHVKSAANVQYLRVYQSHIRSRTSSKNMQKKFHLLYSDLLCRPVQKYTRCHFYQLYSGLFSAVNIFSSQHVSQDATDLPITQPGEPPSSSNTEHRLRKGFEQK